MAQEDRAFNSQRRPLVSPLADEINRQMRRPGGVSPMADQINSQIRTPSTTAPGAPAARAVTVSAAPRAGMGRWFRRGAGALGALAVEAPRVAEEAQAAPGPAGAAGALGKSGVRLGMARTGAQVGGAAFGLPGAVIGGGVGYIGGDQMTDPNSGAHRSMAQYGTTRPLPVAPGGGMFMSPSQIAAGQREGIRPDAVDVTPRASSATRRGGVPFGKERQRSYERGTRPSFANVQGGATTRQQAVPDYLPQVGEHNGFDNAARIGGFARRANADISGNAIDARETMARDALNPMGNNAELMRRMQIEMGSASAKGSPSMRRAIAESFLGQMGALNNATQQGLEDGNEALGRGADNQSDSVEAFADRRLKAQAANAQMSEDRRGGDADRKVSMIQALMSGRRGAGKEPDSFAGQMYEDYLAAGYSPDQAAQLSNRASVLAGSTEETPFNNWGQAQDAIGLDAGLRGHADRWFGYGNTNFDATTATPVGEAGFWDSVLPGGVARGDVRFRDSSGQEAWGTRNSLPAGETWSQNAMRTRMQRELARQRQGAN